MGKWCRLGQRCKSAAPGCARLCSGWQFLRWCVWRLPLLGGIWCEMMRSWLAMRGWLVLVVAVFGRGVGSCPFKEHHYRGDVRPSFQVFGGNDPHWYCYTWGRAGDLFDFLCLYYQITPQEAWERLRQGALM